MDSRRGSHALSGNAHALSFTRASNEGIDYWFPPKETGHWGVDNATGRACADELVQTCGAEALPMVITHIAAAMALKGRFEGIETGFFTRLGEIVASRVRPANDQDELSPLSALALRRAIFRR